MACCELMLVLVLVLCSVLMLFCVILCDTDTKNNQMTTNRKCCGLGETVQAQTIIKHPDMTEAQVEKIKEAWRNVRLVAD